MATTTPELKSSFLREYSQKLSEVSKRQSDYRRALGTRLKNFRRNQIVETNLKTGIAKLRREGSDIKSQVWTAFGAAYNKNTADNLKAIKCHISCEEKLADGIQFLKAGIANINRALGQVTRQIYDLNRRTVPDTRAVENAIKARKRLMLLENQLEVGIHQECKMTAENRKLREELLEHLSMRKIFNDHYFKLIHALNSDKKYMTDLIGYAMHQFDASIELYEKFDILKKRDARDTEPKRMEMRALSSVKVALSNEMEFFKKKNTQRTLAPLQPKEYRRRQNMRESLKKRLAVNKDVLHKIFHYTGNSVNRLYSDIDDLKLENRNTMRVQLEQIQNMERYLHDKRKSNSELKNVSQNNNKRLTKLLQGFKLIRDYSKTDWSILQEVFGDYDEVNLHNLRQQLKLVEKRIFSILAAVYFLERENIQNDPNSYLVKQIEQFCDYVTDVDDIVLTQQCPECAEVDALNADGTESAGILPIESVKKKLCDKVTQPEMQYRLHSMSACRFPRARMLTAKRNLELQSNS
ncbi:PREDICTED: uncharacterized protein LOC108365996 [Rhagoletis zephyria]|uniref:uncharacterized protein LOC108365996 n=1 Tax=Rhagoletis zephyria TaxID=28612 RepID=UPI0008116C8D|nr:PREDICTED: uncharacterized protein LOC108365996 [Rhagoletis zephyria]